MNDLRAKAVKKLNSNRDIKSWVPRRSCSMILRQNKTWIIVGCRYKQGLNESLDYRRVLFSTRTLIQIQWVQDSNSIEHYSSNDLSRQTTAAVVEPDSDREGEDRTDQF